MTLVEGDLVPELSRAVREGAMQLHFQPEVELASGAIVGMEALLRWQHPRRGLLWPADFLSAADSSGLLKGIGRWVVEQCVREAQEWSALPGPGRQMWVNVSPSQLSDPGFVPWVIEQVQAAGLPPKAFGLEITEAAIAGRETTAVRDLALLRKAGIALAIDDFGTWYSTLATIGHLPIDAVKLDRRFVRGVGTDLEEDSIVSSVIRLAHAHGLYVVAEGVESWTEGARLCELECDRAHGFLFSGPLLPAAARGMLSRGAGWRAAAVPPQRTV